MFLLLYQSAFGIFIAMKTIGLHYGQFLFFCFPKWFWNTGTCIFYFFFDFFWYLDNNHYLLKNHFAGISRRGNRTGPQFYPSAPFSNRLCNVVNDFCSSSASACSPGPWWRPASTDPRFIYASRIAYRWNGSFRTLFACFFQLSRVLFYTLSYGNNL